MSQLNYYNQNQQPMYHRAMVPQPMQGGYAKLSVANSSAFYPCGSSNTMN